MRLLIVVKLAFFASFQLDLTLGISALKENQSNFVRKVSIFYDLGGGV